MPPKDGEVQKKIEELQNAITSLRKENALRIKEFYKVENSFKNLNREVIRLKGDIKQRDDIINKFEVEIKQWSDSIKEVKREMNTWCSQQNAQNSSVTVEMTIMKQQIFQQNMLIKKLMKQQSDSDDAMRHLIIQKYQQEVSIKKLMKQQSDSDDADDSMKQLWDLLKEAQDPPQPPPASSSSSPPPPPPPLASSLSSSLSSPLSSPSHNRINMGIDDVLNALKMLPPTSAVV